MRAAAGEDSLEHCLPGIGRPVHPIAPRLPQSGAEPLHGADDGGTGRAGHLQHRAARAPWALALHGPLSPPTGLMDGFEHGWTAGTGPAKPGTVSCERPQRRRLADHCAPARTNAYTHCSRSQPLKETTQLNGSITVGAAAGCRQHAAPGRQPGTGRAAAGTLSTPAAPAAPPCLEPAQWRRCPRPRAGPG